MDTISRLTLITLEESVRIVCKVLGLAQDAVRMERLAYAVLETNAGCFQCGTSLQQKLNTKYF